jgi:spore coat protein A
MSRDVRTEERHSYRNIGRRTVLKGAAAVGLFSTVPWSVGRVRALTGSTPASLTSDRWADPLPVPGVMTPASRRGGVDRYEIEMTEFDQQVLPASTGKTTRLWGYGGSYPAATIEARPGRGVEVEWINGLPETHLLSVDDRIHGAEPPAPAVRTVVHLHGAVTGPEDDGYPEAWVAPDGTTDPASPVPYKPVQEYPNEQEPATMWYHDHAIGITRLNVYAGLAGFYLLRNPVENSLPSGEFEVPILVQDRSFEADGSLYYPPGDDAAYEAEFFGDVPVVNGKAYPFLEVEPRSYRFRLLNGSNGRTFDLALYNETTGSGTDVPPMRQIGVDLGFLPEVVTLGPGGDVPSLLLSGAERADVIVDFSGFEGRTFTLTNDAEAPYTGQSAGSDLPEIMQFRVTKPLSGPDDSVPPERFLEIVGRVIDRYGFEPDVTDSEITRKMTLDSGEHGGLDTHFLNLTLWDDPAAVVRPTLDTSEVWELYNTTGDSHPIHTHLADFEVLDRQTFDAEGFVEARDDDPDVDPTDYLTAGTVRPPTPNNRVKKDTVLVNPNEVVRIRPAFTGAVGRYVWHCHILEHEDQEMMLPFEVVP